MTKTNNNLPPILSIGTAIVTKVEVKGTNGEMTSPIGATGVIVYSPVDAKHSYSALRGVN